jgi:hypothetical protein
VSKQERRGKLGDLIGLVIVGGAGYLFLEPTYGKIFVVAAWIFVFTVWLLAFMPTSVTTTSAPVAAAVRSTASSEVAGNTADSSVTLSGQPLDGEIPAWPFV